MKEKITRKEQAGQTEEKIFTIALELIQKCGFSNVSIKDICQEAEVSIGSFYHYFPSKQNIIVKLLNNYDEKYKSYNENLTTQSSLEKLLVLFSKIADTLEEVGALISIEIFIYHIATKDNFMFSQQRNIYMITRQIIQEAVDHNKILLHESVEEITRMILIYFRGLLYDWCLNSGRYSLKSEVQKQMKFYLTLFFNSRYHKGTDK